MPSGFVPGKEGGGEGGESARPLALKASRLGGGLESPSVTRAEDTLLLPCCLANAPGLGVKSEFQVFFHCGKELL